MTTDAVTLTEILALRRDLDARGATTVTEVLWRALQRHLATQEPAIAARNLVRIQVQLPLATRHGNSYAVDVRPVSLTAGGSRQQAYSDADIAAGVLPPTITLSHPEAAVVLHWLGRGPEVWPRVQRTYEMNWN